MISFNYDNEKSIIYSVELSAKQIVISLAFF